MYIVTRKGSEPSVHHSLLTATQEAVKVTDPLCWIWRLESSRLGTLKRIEVPREDIQSSGIEGIWCIQNRSQQDDLEPVEGQLFFSGTGGRVEVLEYHRERQPEQHAHRLGRFVREASEQTKLLSPEAVGCYLQKHIYTPFELLDQEEMWVLLLNSRLEVTHEVLAYRGQVGQINVRPAELLKEAVRFNAPALILSHSHPSGDPEPSSDDLALTARVKEAARLLDIRVHDHLIVGQDSWVSLQERMAF